MDHLLQCAKNFERLANFKYGVIVGSKGKTVGRFSRRKRFVLSDRKTVKMMDRAIANLERGKVSEPVDLSDFESKT